MKEKDLYLELNSIKNLMERSSKFISLSGLSGILAGVYALIGAVAGYILVYGKQGGLQYRGQYVNEPSVLQQLFMVASAVLLLSISTGILLTIRKAKRKAESYWNPVSKNLLTSMLIPLVTGGLLIVIMLFQGHYGIIASACLIFYGLALVSGSHYTFNDVKWLGLCEIFLGLLAALFPVYGLLLWTVGFSILHLVYGTIMHFKYDR